MDRIRDQKNQVQQSEKKLDKMTQALKEFKQVRASSTPEAFFSKMEEECRMNQYLSEETLPKKHEAMQSNIRDLNSIVHENSVSEQDLQRIEKEISTINQNIAQLAEKKHKLCASGDANLALFRQQASIISNKKEGTLKTLNSVTKEVNDIKNELSSKEEQYKASVSAKILAGDEFKRYVSELRGKSTTYKRKKSELSALMVEHGILSRTLDVYLIS